MPYPPALPGAASVNFSLSNADSAVISPVSASFDKNPANQADVSAAITWNNAASVSDVKNGGATIGLGLMRCPAIR
jgi:hypothetical protein